MSNLTLRIITALIGATLIIFAILWNEYTYCSLLFFLGSVLHYEYLLTTKNIEGYNYSKENLLYNLITGMVIQLLFIIDIFQPSEYLLYFIIPIIALLFIFELFRHTQNPFINIGVNITGLFYIILPICLLYFFTLSDPVATLVILLFVWTCDTMAYFTGKAFGKHKLFERISPKKTWEGFFGGLVFSIVAAFVINRFYSNIDLTNLIIIGIMIAIIGTLGDLVESMLKRSIHIKDSSSILPGHGGFLDRFDAFLICVPFVFVYILFMLETEFVFG